MHCELPATRWCRGSRRRWASTRIARACCSTGWWARTATSPASTRAWRCVSARLARTTPAGASGHNRRRRPATAMFALRSQNPSAIHSGYSRIRGADKSRSEIASRSTTAASENASPTFCVKKPSGKSSSALPERSIGDNSFKTASFDKGRSRQSIAASARLRPRDAPLDREIRAFAPTAAIVRSVNRSDVFGENGMSRIT